LNTAGDFFAKKCTNLDAMDGGDMCRVPYVQDEMPAEAVNQKIGLGQGAIQLFGIARTDTD
jgi:hypothetical protein